MGGIPIWQNLWILWPNEWGLVNIMLHSGLSQQNICVDGWLQWTYTTLLQSFEMLLCQIGVYTLYSLVHQENGRNEQLLDQIHVPQSTKDKGHMVPKSSLLESGFVVSLYTIIYLCTNRSLQDNTISALFWEAFWRKKIYDTDYKTWFL